MITEGLVTIGSHAWKQIHANKLELLYQYDLSKIYSKGRIVESTHGQVAEALFRKWLQNFLPSKYGVTSGYIISQHHSFDNIEKLNHFDVIIYDRINSPILWIEENKDQSAQGTNKAIPVEYVQGVIEVKANLTKYSSTSAVEKLNQLIPYLSNEKDLNKINGKLPKNFFCTTVFFELTKSNDNKKNILDNMIPDLKLGRYFYGGIILRSEILENSIAGNILLLSSDQLIPENSIHKPFSLSESLLLSKGIELPNKRYFMTSISWSKNSFVKFMFDLIALLERKYKPGYSSSSYGFVGMKKIEDRK